MVNNFFIKTIFFVFIMHPLQKASPRYRVWRMDSISLLHSPWATRHTGAGCIPTSALQPLYFPHRFLRYSERRLTFPEALAHIEPNSGGSVLTHTFISAIQIFGR
jgi:hypothetical protein